MRPLRRRRLLKVTALGATVGLAGCAAGERDNAFRTIRLIDYDESPDGVPMDVDMAVSRPEITADEPATIRIEMTNVGDERLNTHPVFHKGYSGTWDERGIALWSQSAPDRPSEQEAVACIRGEGREKPWPGTEEMAFSRIESGDTLRVEYRVSYDPGQDECFPAGEYRFAPDDLPYYTGEGGTPPSIPTFDWECVIEVVE